VFKRLRRSQFAFSTGSARPSVRLQTDDRRSYKFGIIVRRLLRQLRPPGDLVGAGSYDRTGRRRRRNLQQVARTHEPRTLLIIRANADRRILPVMYRLLPASAVMRV